MVLNVFISAIYYYNNDHKMSMIRLIHSITNTSVSSTQDVKEEQVFQPPYSHNQEPRGLLIPPTGRSSCKPIGFADQKISKSCAFYIDGESFFRTEPVITYNLDFSDKAKFITAINTVILPSETGPSVDLEKFRQLFPERFRAILLVMIQLTQEERYDQLKVPSVKQIIIRDSNRKGIVINNTRSRSNKSMYFDMGTVLRCE